MTCFHEHMLIDGVVSTTIFAGIDLGLQSKIQIPIVIYQGLQLAFGSILVVIFRKWVDAKKKQDQEVEQHRSVETEAKTEE